MNNQPYEKITLKNGVRLLLIPQNEVESIATCVMVGVGSRYEETWNNGISHFLEHMVFKGTKKYPTMEDVTIIEKIGGVQNAYTDIDITNYHNKVLADDWELSLEINKELAINPRLTQEHVDKERMVIIEEMKRYEDEPEAKAEETLHTMMYPGMKLGMMTIGTEKSLNKVASKELQDYHRKWYVPERIVVVIAGKIAISDKKKVIDKVEDWFGGLPKVKTDNIEKVHIEQKGPQVKVVTKPDAQQAHFNMALRIFERSSEARFAWSVFNIAMGVGFTSRLFKEIREKRGLCYHVRSNSNNWDETGYWDIYAGVATDRVGEAVTAICEELTKARNHGVTDEEVTIAKKRLNAIIAFRSENPEFLTEFYGRQELYNQPIMTVKEYLNRINQVTKEEINKLLVKYITTNTLNLALVWNKPEDPKLQNLLRI